MSLTDLEVPEFRQRVPNWVSERYLVEELGDVSARRQRHFHKTQIAQGK